MERTILIYLYVRFCKSGPSRFSASVLNIAYHLIYLRDNENF